MKIITWNTAGRTKKIPEQWEHIQALNADIVCLQEVQQGGDAKWMDCLKSAYEYVFSSHGFEPNRSKTGPRKYHLIIASNIPMELCQILWFCALGRTSDGCKAQTFEPSDCHYSYTTWCE